MFEVGRLVARIALEGEQSVTAGLKKVQTEFTGLGKKGLESMSKVGTGVGIAGAAILGLAAIAVKTFADFDHSMSAVQANTHATAKEMTELGHAATQAGTDTVFTATNAADAISELGKAGVQTKDIISGGLSGALSLASAGNVSVADSATIAATALSLFKLKGSDIPHVADLIAAATTKAQGTTDDFAQALQEGGVEAAQSGKSIEETAGVLTLFAHNGLLAGRAGTAMKEVLVRLENPSTQAQASMRQFGINVYDSSGQMLSFAGIADQLKSKLGGLTEQQRATALATIFGARALSAASILYDAGGKGVESWTNKINQSGYAAETARLKLDNLTGDLHFLQGSIQSDLIVAGTGANTVLRTMIQNVTGLVNWIGTLPAPVLNAGLGITALVGAGLAFVGTIFKVVPAVSQFKSALSDLNGLGKAASTGIGVAAGAAGVLILVLGVFIQQQAAATAAAQQFGQTLNQTTGAITENTKALAAQKLASHIVELGLIDTGKSAYDLGQKYHISSALITEASQGNVKALAEFKKATDSTVFGWNGLSKATQNATTANNDNGAELGRLRQTVLDMAAAVDSGRHSLEQTNKATADGTDASKGLATSLNAEQQAGQGATNALDSLTQALQSYGSDALTARDASRAYQQAIDDATASIKTNGATLDITTQKGRDNQAALDKIASSADAAAAAIYKQTGSTDQAAAALEAGKQAYISTAVQMGLTQQAAADLAAQIIATPDQLAISVKVEGLDTAASQLTSFYDSFGRISKLPANQAILKPGALSLSGKGAFGAKSANGNIFFANGGFSEQHVAQISAAGQSRIWNEPETGGEAYIPLAESKRARSTAILTEVARRFGYGEADTSTKTPIVVPPRGPSQISGTLSIPGLGGMMEAYIEGVLDDVATEYQGGNTQS